MSSRLAALVAVCFAAAVSAPRTGLVVHRHASGDHLHVHPGLEDRPHHHDGLEPHHDHLEHHHEHAEHDHPLHDTADRPALVAGTEGWHAHWTQPFHRVAPSKRPALARPQPVSRPIAMAPRERVAAALIPSRSRAPPSGRPI